MYATKHFVIVMISLKFIQANTVEQKLEKQTALLDYIISGKNLAYNKPCGSSSILQGCLPESAVDGYLTTFQHTQTERRPYWWVDLGRNFLIKRVFIYNRQSHGGRLHNVQVTVGNNLHSMNPCGYYHGPGGNGEHIMINCKSAIRGRISTGNNNILQVAEVQVFGSW